MLRPGSSSRGSPSAFAQSVDSRTGESLESRIFPENRRKSEGLFDAPLLDCGEEKPSKLPRLDLRTSNPFPDSTILVPSRDVDKKALPRRPRSSALACCRACWRSFSSKVLSEKSPCCDEPGRSSWPSPRLDPEEWALDLPGCGIPDAPGPEIFVSLFPVESRRDRHSLGAGLGEPWAASSS